MLEAKNMSQPNQQDPAGESPDSTLTLAVSIEADSSGPRRFSDGSSYLKPLLLLCSVAHNASVQGVSRECSCVVNTQTLGPSRE